MYFNNLLKAASLGVALGAFVAADANSQQGRVFGGGNAVAVEDLPAGAFKNAVRALPPQARGRALGILRDSHVPEADFEHMRVNGEGFVYYVDPLPDETPEEAAEAAPPSEITEATVFTLHSKPGSANTLYVDFDGHILRGTVWNSTYAMLDMLPFNVEGSADTFTQAEIDRIAEGWRRVAEDFAPFDVDVTTEEPPFTVLSDGEIYYGPNTGHALVTNRIDRFGNPSYNCSCGGVSYVGPWGSVGYSTNLNFNTSLSSNAMTISHETGHLLGLSHDGTTTQGYYGGHGSGATSWGPIMGAPFGMSVVTWSRATYPNANNNQDDYLYIIDNIPFRTDDHVDVDLLQATPLVVTGGVNVVGTSRVTDPSWSNLANKGIIEDQSDIDLFSMNISPGLVSLSIKPATYQTFTGNQGADLDIEAKLLDEFGTVLQTSNPDLALDATINYNVTVAGTYYLEITGVGRGDPLVNGYTDYGIIGQYYINGTIPEDVTVTGPPAAPTNLSALLSGDVNIDLTWDDNNAPPETDEAGYRVLRSVNGGTFALRANLPRDSEAFSDNNLGNGDYSYKVEAHNSQGSNEAGPTAPIDIDAPVVAVATSESMSSGAIVSGSYVSTQSSAGSETLREQHQGGKPKNRRSFLDHTWFVTGVQPGATVTLYVTAGAPPNAELDDFVFTYSVNGGSWQDLGTIVQGSGGETLMASLPESTSGTVRVRVVDSDPSTSGASNLDEVTVSEIKITSGGDPVQQPPVVDVLDPTDGITVQTNTQVTFAATADDFEDGDISASISWSSDRQGPLGGGPSISPMMTVNGMHTVTASVTDSSGKTAADVVTVNVSNTPTASDMWVADLEENGVSAGRGGKWSAEVTIHLIDDLGDPVSGATVNGSWSNGANGGGSCGTSGSGSCTISKGGLKGNVGSVTFSVDSVSGSLTYVPGNDVEDMILVLAP